MGKSTLRIGVTLCAVAIGLVAYIDEAAAQYYPPPYDGYRAPPPGYRPAPMPDDDDDDADAPPGVFSRPPGAIPNGANSARPPYPYGSQQQPNASRGFDPRYGTYSGNQEIESSPLPPPRYGNSPNNSSAPGTAYNARPQDGYDPMRSPGAVDANRPPVDLSPGNPSPRSSSPVAALPPEDQPEQETKELPPNLKRQLVDYQTIEPPGTIIIDTPHTYLYLVLPAGKAMRYGIGVGREGFTWSGIERIKRMAEWPDWIPPKEMIDRQPYLPRFMAGGESNPLGARALYLGNSLYRIHGTNQPSTIGSFVSSGCIRLTNADIEDLYRRVQVGTRVVVLPGPSTTSASAGAPPPTH
jgi:lipoprotein-anchoring transpeptidase ErfK/SrfK